MQGEGAVQANFLEEASLRGQLEATLWAKTTFSSHCRLSRELAEHANLCRPLLSVP